jgi:predicted CopG family antitoxin
MSKVVRISDEAYETIAKNGAFNESFTEALERLLKQAGKQ